MRGERARTTLNFIVGGREGVNITSVCVYESRGIFNSGLTTACGVVNIELPPNWLRANPLVVVVAVHVCVVRAYGHVGARLCTNIAQP